MASVFISSIQAGFEDVRGGARAGVESAGHQAVMAETSGAAAASPQRALLDRVAAADVFLLLVGSRYGERQASGLSATEEEFEQARRLGKPILVLVQSSQRDSDQNDFLARATGGWEAGIFRDTFERAADVGLAVVRALRNLENRGARAELEPSAAARARELAEAVRRGGFGQAGAPARVVLVPLLGRRILDAVALENVELPDQLAGAARGAGLVSQSDGIQVTASADGFVLEVGVRHAGGATLSVGAKGEIVVEASVAGAGRNFGSMRVVPELVARALRGAFVFAEDVWTRVDLHGEVVEVAVSVAIPSAQLRSWGEGNRGDSISMAGTWRMPETAIAPQPARVIRRADLARPGTTTTLVAEMRRLFLDAGAVDEA